MFWNIVLLIVILMPVTMIAIWLHGGELVNAGENYVAPPPRPLTPDELRFEYLGRIAWIALCAAVVGTWWWVV